MSFVPCFIRAIRRDSPYPRHLSLRYPIGHVLIVFENYKRTWPVNLRLDGEVIVLWKATNRLLL
jgi:hypothetical protein